MEPCHLTNFHRITRSQVDCYRETNLFFTNKIGNPQPPDCLVPAQSWLHSKQIFRFLSKISRPQSLLCSDNVFIQHLVNTEELNIVPALKMYKYQIISDGILLCQILACLADPGLQQETITEIDILCIAAQHNALSASGG